MSKQPKKTKKPVAQGKKATTKKSTLSAAIRRRIRARNRRFRALSPSEKRVAIAKDVIEQLGLKKIVAECGTYFASGPIDSVIERYFNAAEGVDTEDVDTSDPKDLRAAADKIEAAQKVTEQLAQTELCDMFAGDAKCTVCGIGAAFVSAVRLGDDLKIKDIQDVYDHDQIEDGLMREYLKRYFDPKQVVLIECAFETSESFRTADGWDSEPDDADVNAAVEFGYKHGGPTARMRAIFQNIIANNGTFAPPPVKDDEQETP